MLYCQFSDNFCSVDGYDYAMFCVMKQYECYKDGDDTKDYDGECNHPVGQYNICIFFYCFKFYML